VILIGLTFEISNFSNLQPAISLDCHGPGCLSSFRIQSIDKSSYKKEGNSLNKGELVGKIAKEASLTKRQAEQAFNTLIDSISMSLKKGRKVTIVGFGTFSVSKRKARKGRNPQTGALIKIPAHKVPKFSPGTDLKAAVRGR
jgi:DNA-binding protein HU-beta